MAKFVQQSVLCPHFQCSTFIQLLKSTYFVLKLNIYVYSFKKKKEQIFVNYDFFFTKVTCRRSL